VSTDSINAFASPAAPQSPAPVGLLQFSSIPRLRRLALGALGVGVAVLGHLAAALVAGYFHAWHLATAIHAAAAVLVLVGIGLLTTLDSPQRPAPVFLALATRGFALAAAVMWIATASLTHAAHHLLWLTVPALIAMAGTGVALGLLAGRLAGRIPHDGLARQFRNFPLLLPPCFALVIFFQFVDPTPYYLYFFGALPLLGALIGMTLWVAATLLRLAWELRVAHRQHLALTPF
jgi:hypothetical protein